MDRMVRILFNETQTLKTNIQQLPFCIYKQDHNAVGSQINAQAIFEDMKTRDKTPIMLQMELPRSLKLLQKHTHTINDVFYL